MKKLAYLASFFALIILINSCAASVTEVDDAEDSNSSAALFSNKEDKGEETTTFSEDDTENASSSASLPNNEEGKGDETTTSSSSQSLIFQAVEDLLKYNFDEDSLYRADTFDVIAKMKKFPMPVVLLEELEFMWIMGRQYGTFIFDYMLPPSELIFASVYISYQFEDFGEKTINEALKEKISQKEDRPLLKNRDGIEFAYRQWFDDYVSLYALVPEAGLVHINIQTIDYEYIQRFIDNLQFTVLDLDK